MRNMNVRVCGEMSPSTGKQGQTQAQADVTTRNTRWQDDLQPILNLIIHTGHFSSLIYLDKTRAHYILSHICELKPTWIHDFIPSLHNGPVDAWHQPRAYKNTAQQPHNAVADAHDDIVEKEEVIEAVECLSDEEERNTYTW